jgi:hypothetical protein
LRGCEHRAGSPLWTRVRVGILYAALLLQIAFFFAVNICNGVPSGRRARACSHVRGRLQRTGCSV